MELFIYFISIFGFLVMVRIIQEYFIVKQMKARNNLPYNAIKQMFKIDKPVDASKIEEKLKGKLGEPTNRNYVIIGTGCVGCAILDLLLQRGFKKKIKFLV